MIRTACGEAPTLLAWIAEATWPGEAEVLGGLRQVLREVARDLFRVHHGVAPGAVAVGVGGDGSAVNLHAPAQLIDGAVTQRVADQPHRSDRRSDGLLEYGRGQHQVGGWAVGS